MDIQLVEAIGKLILVGIKNVNKKINIKIVFSVLFISVTLCLATVKSVPPVEDCVTWPECWRKFSKCL